MMIPGINGSVLASAYKASKLKRRYADGGPIKPSAKLNSVDPQGQASYQAGLQSGPVNLGLRGAANIPQFKNTSLQPSLEYKAKSLSTYLNPQNVGGSYQGKSTYLNADYNIPTQQTNLAAGYNSDKLSLNANANLEKNKLMGAGVDASYNVTPNLSVFGDLRWDKQEGQAPTSYNVGFSYKKQFKDGGPTNPSGGWAGWTPNTGKPYLRTSPAGNAGYSDNTRVVNSESNLTDADRERIAQIQLAKRVGTISQGKKETAYEKAKRKSSFVEREKERTGNASPISYVMDAVNPATVAFSAMDFVGNTGSAVKNTAQGNFADAGSDLLQAGVNALGVLPAASQLKNVAKPLSKLARLSPSQYKSVQQFANNPADQTGKYLNNKLSGAGKAIDSQIFKSPKLTLLLDEGRRIKSLDNVTYSPGLQLGNVKSFKDIITTKKGKGDISDIQFFKGLEKGSVSLNKSLQKRVSDLESPEGFNRLVNQEKEYLVQNGTDAGIAERVAKLNAKARIDELKNTSNINAEASDYASSRAINDIPLYNKYTNNKSLYDNAYFDQTHNYTTDDKLKNIINNSATVRKSGQKIGQDFSQPKPGGIGMGYNLVNNKPIEMHEIGHALQRGRKLPIDDELRQLTPKKNLSANSKHQYTYFKEGSAGKESSAFANELRESMYQKGFIPDYYSPINEQQVQSAYKYFKKNPIGIYDKKDGSFLSNTRIFDFMEPNKANSKLLTDVLNKLPAAAPIGVGVAAGASQLSKKPEMKKGGKVDQSNDDKEMVEGVVSILRDVKSKKNRLQLANKLAKQFNREKVDYNLSDFLNKSKVRK